MDPASCSNESATRNWTFPVTALDHTPSVDLCGYTVEHELFERARGVHFLFRLASSLMLPRSSMFTAATWFHRFYMRNTMEDFHIQSVAASCIFLATKTEECGRKLRDVARVAFSKLQNIDVATISQDNKEVDECQRLILLTEEVLLEAICFDFVVDNPHALLVDLFGHLGVTGSEDEAIEEYAWSTAHDTYRTPACLLYSPKVIATACHIFAQRVHAGQNSASLDSRISYPTPSASLPTPPTHAPSSPDGTRTAIEYFKLTEDELGHLADVLTMIVEFYHSQDSGAMSHMSSVSIEPPTISSRRSLYTPFGSAATTQDDMANGTPISLHGEDAANSAPSTLSDKMDTA